MVDEMIRETLPSTADTFKQDGLKTNIKKQVSKKFVLKLIEIYRKATKIVQS